jgi:hypothetical protein
MKLATKQQSEISIYSPLSEGLSKQIQGVVRRDSTSADVTLLGTSFKPDPYVQVGSPDEKGDMTFEVISNTFLETKLTEWQISKLISLGWNAPNSQNPNFWITASTDDTLEAAQFMVYAMHSVFGLEPDTWFTFGTSPTDEAMNNSGLFWRMKSKSGIVCLPGQNISETVEGQS